MTIVSVIPVLRNDPKVRTAPGSSCGIFLLIHSLRGPFTSAHVASPCRCHIGPSSSGWLTTGRVRTRRALRCWWCQVMYYSMILGNTFVGSYRNPPQELVRTNLTVFFLCVQSILSDALREDTCIFPQTDF